MCLTRKSPLNKPKYTVLVSAPDHNSLQAMCDRFAADLKLNIEESEWMAGKTLDSFTVKPILVVTTEGNQLPVDWVRPWNRETERFGLEVQPADNWNNGSVAPGGLTVFLLNSQKVSDKQASLVSSLPEKLRTWSSKPESGT